MVDKKITDYAALTAAASATGDLIEIVDISEAAVEDQNKSMDRTQLRLMTGSAIGKQTITIPASGLSPSVTAGCAVFASFETTAGRPDIKGLAFDSVIEEHAQIQIAMPKKWDLGTITFQPFWTKIAAPTGGLDGVAWGLQAVAVGDDESFDQVYGTEILVGLDTVKSTEDLFVGAESAVVTIANTPAANNVVEFQISRVVASGSPLDDMDVDAWLTSLKIFYTILAGTDD